MLSFIIAMVTLHTYSIARWQIVNNESIWTNDKFNKKIVITGHAGSLEQSQPTFRWNNSSAGRNEFRVNGRVYGYPGAGGGNNSDPGGNGGNSMHIASFLEIRNATSLVRSVVVAEVEAVADTAMMDGRWDTVQLKDVRVTSAGSSKKNVKRMVVKAANMAMEEKEKGKGYKWTGNAWNQTDRSRRQRRWSGR